MGCILSAPCCVAKSDVTNNGSSYKHTKIIKLEHLPSPKHRPRIANTVGPASPEGKHPSTVDHLAEREPPLHGLLHLEVVDLAVHLNLEFGHRNRVERSVHLV